MKAGPVDDANWSCVESPDMVCAITKLRIQSHKERDSSEKEEKALWETRFQEKVLENKETKLQCKQEKYKQQRETKKGLLKEITKESSEVIMKKEALRKELLKRILKRGSFGKKGSERSMEAADFGND